MGFFTKKKTNQDLTLDVFCSYKELFSKNFMVKNISKEA